MKIDLKSWGTREDWEFLLRRVSRFFVRLGKVILISHIHITELVITLIVLGVALFLGIVFLYLPPDQSAAVEPKPLELNTKVLDRLISWKQEREQKRNAGFQIPVDTLFP